MTFVDESDVSGLGSEGGDFRVRDLDARAENSWPLLGRA